MVAHRGARHRAVRWHRHRSALRWIAARYLPWLFVLSLAWEAVHVRLYTLWHEADPAYIVLSVVHCTFGDLLIGAASLGLALIMVRAGALPAWPWRTIALVTTLIGVAYTIFSEWMNITLLRSWAYSEGMPTMRLGSFEVGWTPLAQWLLLPSLILYLGRRA
jgi:hypothetical protein